MGKNFGAGNIGANENPTGKATSLRRKS